MATPPKAPAEGIRAEGIRIDRWLFFARFFKSRSLAGRIVGGGHVRLNGQHVRRAAQLVRVGDVLTFPAGRRIVVARVLALGRRRGPATEAQSLYEDLTPPEARPGAQPGTAARIGPRPTKRARRQMEQIRRDRLE